MKKLLVISFLLCSSPAFAWYDAYGGFTCGYMDPLTSFLDDIFGPPCPPPVAVVPVQPVPVVPVQPVQMVPVVPYGRPIGNPYGYWW